MGLFDWMSDFGESAAPKARASAAGPAPDSGNADQDRGFLDRFSDWMSPGSAATNVSTEYTEPAGNLFDGGGASAERDVSTEYTGPVGNLFDGGGPSVNPLNTAQAVRDAVRNLFGSDDEGYTDGVGNLF